MSQDVRYVPLPGSERVPLPEVFPQARAAGALDPEECLEITIALRPPGRNQQGEPALAMSTRPLSQRTYLSREEFAAQRGADPDEMAAIQSFAQNHGLDVVEADATRRTVVLSGTVRAMSDAFQVQLTRYELPSGVVRGRSGPLHVPEQLAPIVQTVTGLDNRPQATPKFRLLDDRSSNAVQAHAAGISYTPPQIAQLYNFPQSVDGAGQCIGILEFGGGFDTADLQAYFSGLSIPVPAVSTVSVDGAGNTPVGNPNSADGEVLLDIEIAGSIAPKASIVVYFAPNTSRGFIDALTTAIHDTTNKPSILSISWGGPEASWTSATMHAMNAAFQDAATLGVSVFCAAGDSGSSDGMKTGAHVDYPASDPGVTGCGGTRLEASGTAITSETVWNDTGNGATGGGVSAAFPRPVWQSDANVPQPPGTKGGRGVPDVAGDASPLTGYRIRVDGQQAVFGGTSAVAPLWAALAALIIQQLGRPLGFMNPLLYNLPTTAAAFHDITAGTNGAYSAGPGWDPCTGLGSPDGTRLASALGG